MTEQLKLMRGYQMMNNKTGECFYHVIRDGALRMTVRGSELKDTDIVESVDEPDSRTQLVADIQAWLESNIGFSVWITDLMEQVHGWLDRQNLITERRVVKQREEQCSQLVNDMNAAREQRDRWRDNWRERNDSYSELASENDDLREQVDELKSKVDQLEMSNRYGWECECKLQAERDYWKQEVQFCMDAAYPPSHAPERPYDPRVMAYPTPDECTMPSTLVSEVIDGLRDDVRDTVMPIVEESANAKADCERWREACGSMMDAAHEIQRIMREFEEK